MNTFTQCLDLFEKIKIEYNIEKLTTYGDRYWKINMCNDGILIDIKKPSKVGTIYETCLITIAPFESDNVEDLMMEITQLFVLENINAVEKTIRNLIKYAEE